MDSEASQATSQKKGNATGVIIAVSVVGIAVLVAGLYILVYAPQIESLYQQVETKEVQITLLENNLEASNTAVTELELKLQGVSESYIALQRELTTFAEVDNPDNLINSNSLITTLDSVDLLSEPEANSEVLHSVPSDQTGEVIDGLRLVDGEVWWKIGFKTGEQGWVQETFLERIPSVVIRIDTDQDGESDIKIRWEGEYDLDGIVAEPGVDGTYIRYKGEAMPEPYEVTEL